MPSEINSEKPVFNLPKPNLWEKLYGSSHISAKKVQVFVSSIVGLYFLLVPLTVKVERDKHFQNEEKQRFQSILTMAYRDIEQSAKQSEIIFTLVPRGWL